MLPLITRCGVTESTGDEKFIALASRGSLGVPDAEEKPIKRRGIIEQLHLVSLVDLPSIILVNILSRLSLDDIFISFFIVCKSITKLIIELIVDDPHYFTEKYKENYSGRYFLVTKKLFLGHLETYFGELRRAGEFERSCYFYNKIEYVFDSTRWTRQKLRCCFDAIKTSYSIGGFRAIIVSCNGILCLRLQNPGNHVILVTNPIFGDDEDNVFIWEPAYQISKISVADSYYYKKEVAHYPMKELVLMGSGMGFGCTRGNCNKFKVLIVKNYVYDCDSHMHNSCGNRFIKIGIDNQPCVKATSEILTLGTDHDWRVLPEEDCWFWCCHSHTVVTFDGTFFWIVHCSRNDVGLDPSASRCVCAAFDIEEEKARAIELPPQFKHIDDYYGGLVVLGNNLCLYDNITYQAQIIVWKMMMETTIEHSIWSVEFIINKCMLLVSPTNFIAHERTNYVPITKMPTGEILMFCRRNRTSCIYDPNTKEYALYIDGVGDQAIPYTPNFASLKAVIKRGSNPEDR